MARPSHVPGRFPRLPIVLAGACLAAVACGGPDGGPDTAAPPAQQNEQQIPPPPPAAPEQRPTLGDVDAEGELAMPGQAENAFTYNPALAPPGAEISVAAEESENATEVRLEVDGLLPNRGYAAHAHAQPCGRTGDAAGPHFQNEVDPAATPEQPSTDPAYANPQNEIWLDLRTDDEGDGETRTEVPFVLRDRAPASVVIHQAESTATGPGEAGTAGARLACLNVEFHNGTSG